MEQTGHLLAGQRRVLAVRRQHMLEATDIVGHDQAGELFWDWEIAVRAMTPEHPLHGVSACLH